MAIWTPDVLSRIGDVDHLDVVTRRRDGTPRKPLPVWAVRVEDTLFLRPVRGRYSGWYRATQERPDGVIRVDGESYEVRFELADPSRGDAIDEAYRAKYRDKSPTHVDPILAPSAREVTLQLIPVEPGESSS